MNSLVTSTLLTAVVVAVLAQGADRSVADKVMKLTRDSTWTRVASIPIAFRTFHPQGMVKIGDTFYVSSVEVTKPTTRFATPVEGKDRDAGAGVGHLFKIDRTGTLVADVRLGEDTIYHPGGIDYDGKNLGSRRGVPSEQPFDRLPRRSGDDEGHRGLSVRRSHRRDRARHGRQMLHGVSWGSRRFYRWPLDPRRAGHRPRRRRRRCHARTRRTTSTIRTASTSETPDALYRRHGTAPPSDRPFRLGGIDLVDLADGRPLHQVPILLWTDDGLDMTHNPVWIEATAQGLRGYFMPEDERSTIYVYDVRTEER